MQYDVDTLNTLDKVHQILMEMYDGPYPLRDIVRDLAPSCDGLILRCSLLGVMSDCDKLFRPRITDIGKCCAINYQRPSFDNLGRLFRMGKQFPKKIPIYFPSGGPFFTLSIVLKNEYEDFAYQLNSHTNFRILMYEPQDYPDALIGSVSENLIEANTQADITIDPVYLEGHQSMHSFPPETRHCYFDDEGGLPLKGFYSKSECIIYCRIKEMMKACGCIAPFNPNMQNESFCLLNDLPCIAGWHERWVSFNSFYSEVDYAHAYPCAGCYGACNDIKYKFSKSWIGIVQPPEGENFTFGMLKGLRGENLAVFNIYFTSSYIRKMIQSVTGRWIDLLSYFGGICGLMLGGSIISCAELVYFVTGKYFVIWFRCIKYYFKRHKRQGHVKEADEIGVELFWNEIGSKRMSKRL